MRIQTFAIACTVTAVSTISVYAQDAAKPAVETAKPKPAAPAMTAKQKASYGIGMNVGRSIKQQGLGSDDLDVNAVARGIFDALAGKEPALSQAELSAAFAELQRMIESKKAAVTAVKNQGNCGACWAFSVTGAIEGAYAIATGALRSLSEQQMIDCSTSTGNGGCHGGNQANAFTYAISNKGLDSEKDYAYDGADDPCWTAAAKRVVATVDSAVKVPPNDEAALAAAVAIAPVAVSIEASTKFRQYKSGIFQGAMSCGNTSTSLNHAVLVVGFTADAWIVVRHDAS